MPRAAVVVRADYAPWVLGVALRRVQALDALPAWAVPSDPPCSVVAEVASAALLAHQAHAVQAVVLAAPKL